MADDLNWLLRRLVEAVPNTRSALLLSVDGIPKYWYGLDNDGADRLAALASSMRSLASQVGTTFSSGGAEGVRQVIIELNEVILFVTAAGAGSVLAVLAAPDVDAGILSYEMQRLCTQVPAVLVTPARHRVGSAPSNGSR
ncbi:roadblock/LC7 domain-containing protein [Actinokineospora sp. HUAS TT18]|uniref:roadblock/LC7 domain-containing protein n=1 Tax=Actinokineospora sp. HUAS TT18 TaxID=3447451 RepID=UPI003F5204EF